MEGKKRGQVAVEFLLLVSIAFMIFLVYTTVTRNEMTNLISEEEYILLKDAVYTARNEILVASRVEDGYYREFEIPEKIGLKNYTIYLNQTTDNIIAYSTNHQQAVQIPHANGTLNKGLNIITKSGGNIYLNT